MLFKKGAEAYLYKEDWYGRTVIRKVRIPKPYRHLSLDIQLRRSRTVHEAKILTETRKLGVSTPVIYYIDLPNSTIVMEFIDGIRLKELLIDTQQDPKAIGEKIGRSIGTLHNNNIIHGDLTTSNMILNMKNKKIYFIDFGLAEYSTTLEARGVDLHLIHRVLQSTHFSILDPCFSAILKGYAQVVGQKGTKAVIQRLKDIEQRGRYH